MSGQAAMLPPGVLSEPLWSQLRAWVAGRGAYRYASRISGRVLRRMRARRIRSLIFTHRVFGQSLRAYGSQVRQFG